MAIKVEIKGLRELQAKFKKLPQELKTKVSAIVEDGAKNWVLLAKKDAPVNFGFLRNGISYAFVIADKTRTTFEVVSNSEYSPYMEFGTITHAAAGVARATQASMLPGLPAYALTFKGRGLRKTGGIYPKPFFFKQKPIVAKMIEQRISKIKL